MAVNRRALWIIASGLLLTVVGVGYFLLRDQSLLRLQRAGTIRVGYAIEAPYVFLRPGGEVTGAEAEAAKTIVSRLGIQQIEWRLYEFDELLPALESRQVDAIVAGMFITPERAKLVSFSEPTFHVQQALLVAEGNPKQLHSYRQAAGLPDVRIAVITGSVEETMLRELKISSSQLVHVPDALTGLRAVEANSADGLALSTLTVQQMAAQNQLSRTEMAAPFEQTALPDFRYFGYGGVVFRHDETQLRLTWNAALRDLLASPEYLDLVSPFGYSAAEMPGAVTTEEILSKP